MQHHGLMERVLALIDAAAAAEGFERSRLIDEALREYRRLRRLPAPTLARPAEQEEV